MIIDLVASQPKRHWSGVEIVDALNEYRGIDIMVALAVLCGQGRLERVAVATYRARSITSLGTASSNSRDDPPR